MSKFNIRKIVIRVHKTDSEIKSDILVDMKWDPEVDQTDVGVIVKEGTVILIGSVSTYFQKLAAYRVAKRIKGVRAILLLLEAIRLN